MNHTKQMAKVTLTLGGARNIKSSQSVVNKKRKLFDELTHRAIPGESQLWGGRKWGGTLAGAAGSIHICEIESLDVIVKQKYACVGERQDKSDAGCTTGSSLL